MISEIQRYDWHSFRANGEIEHVPKALFELHSSSTKEDAENAYNKIDNTVITNGLVHQAAIPVTTCLLSILFNCKEAARESVLDLLVEITSGQPAESEISAENESVVDDCIRELCRGVSHIFQIFENGKEREKLLCIDLLGVMSMHDSLLKNRVIWWFNKHLENSSDTRAKTLIGNWKSQIE